MPVEKRTVSISFGQGIDTKTDPNQVMQGKLISLYNAILTGPGEMLAVTKRYGYKPLTTFSTAVSSSSLTNQKMGTLNNQLITFDGKTVSSLSGTNQFLVDNFQGAIPSISIVQREATPIINPDTAYNPNFNTTCYSWASSCIAPNFQQLSFAGSIGKFEILSQSGTIIASTGINNFVKTKCFNVGNEFFWIGVNYATSALTYYELNANGSSANFIPTAIGNVGGDFSSNTSPFGYNRYQRYDGFTSPNGNLYLGWFNPATSSLNISLLTVFGVTSTTAIPVNATGSLGVFGDSGKVWAVYHDGATSAGFVVVSSTSLAVQSGPNPFFTTDTPTTTNQVSIPQAFTGTSNGPAANIYTQWLNYYPALQYSGFVGPLTWPSAQRTDFISKQSLNATTNATSGSSAVVVRSMGLGSRAWNYLGDDYFLGSYGGTQTSTSADRLEPTNFLVTPTKPTNNIVSKIAFENGEGYDFQTGGQAYYQNNNYGSVGYSLPLPNVVTSPASPNNFIIPYLVKTAAIPLSSTSLFEPFFISYNFGLNSVMFNFNGGTLYVNSTFGNNINIAGGYLAAFDGKSVTEQNFHLFPEDVQLVAGSTGLSPNTYSYQVYYQSLDAQGNIFRSAPSKTYNITTSGTSGVFLQVPMCRITNKSTVSIHVCRNAPSIDPLTFHEIAPLSPAINNPLIDNVVVFDNNPDSAIIGNPDIYTSGNVLEDTGAPSPLWMSIYKLRLMLTDSENPNNIWYSKEVIPGTAVEMTDLQTFYVSAKYGSVICHLEMDDKFIIFTSNGNTGAIYYMTGEGPDATGNNNDFSLPTLISTTLTTNNPNGVVLTSDGIMFPSDKGIWLLSHNLSTSYIGAPAEFYNNAVITSANIIPGTTQVRFTLNTGVCLVWDYYAGQWSVFQNINASFGLIYQGLFTYLNLNQTGARIFQETIGQFSNFNTPILISLTTSWLSLAGLQGYQRAHRLYVLSQYKSSHLLNVSLAYDFNPSFSQTSTIIPIQSTNQTWGVDPIWGSVLTWGGNYTPNRRVNFTRQKCQSIQITISEQLNPSSINYGAGLVLENIGVVIGGKLSYPKLPASLTTD